MIEQSGLFQAQPNDVASILDGLKKKLLKDEVETMIIAYETKDGVKDSHIVSIMKGSRMDIIKLALLISMKVKESFGENNE